jgi:hypothetical protein
VGGGEWAGGMESGRGDGAGGVGRRRAGTGPGTVRSKVAERGRIGRHGRLVVTPVATKPLGTPFHRFKDLCHPYLILSYNPILSNLGFYQVW